MTPAPLFSDMLPLTRAEDGVWAGDADPAYSNGMAGAFVGQFGGWVAAALLKAALLEAGETQHARALTAHFFAPVRPGAVSLRVRPLRRGKSVSFLQVDLIQGADMRAQGTITVGAGREDQQAHQFTRRPDAPPADTPGLPQFSPPTPFGRALEARWVSGAPFTGEDGARSVFWSRTASPTRLDAPALALLADYIPPRVFYVTNAFVPSSTLSLTIHFHADAAELTAVGEGHVLVDVRGRRIGGGYWDHSASFFSAEGALLATTEQLALHRG
jgi:acyl-CoA thioesterase